MVTVVATKGSAPREAGARLIVNPDGTFTGTIGGGTLEWRAIALAQAPDAAGREQGRDAEFVLGPDLGQCCGGQVELALEVFDAGERDAVAELAGARGGGPVQYQRPALGDKGIERDGCLDAVEVACRAPPRCADGVLVERLRRRSARPYPLRCRPCRPRAGAGARAAAIRGDAGSIRGPTRSPATCPANVAASRADDPGAVLAAAPAGAFVLVMTHSHQLDLAIVHAALPTSAFPMSA